MKQFFQIVGIVVVFFGTLGLPLFQHTCLQENITIQSVFTPSNHCEKEHLELEVESCCKKEKSISTQFEKKCCVEDQSQLQLSFTYFEHLQLHPFLQSIAVSNFDYPNWIGSVDSEEKQLPSFADSPPFLSSKRLPLLCVWRI